MKTVSAKELLPLLDAAIALAFGIVEKQNKHVPFCMAITTAGKRTSFVADDSKQTDPDALLTIVRQHISDALRERRYRAVAFGRFVRYRSERCSTDEAVQVTLDHELGSPMTCYMPYRMVRGMTVQGSPDFEQPTERFFTHAA